MAAEVEARFTSVERLNHFVKTLKPEGKFVTEDKKLVRNWPSDGSIMFDNAAVSTQHPPQSLKVGPGTPFKFKSSTLGPPSKFKSVTSSPFFNESTFLRIFHIFFVFLDPRPRSKGSYIIGSVCPSVCP